MGMNHIRFSALIIVLALGLYTSALAAVPAPPVNQLIGIPDTVFGQMAEADCRVCHGPNPPPGVDAIIDTTYLPDRHHNLLETTIPEGTAAPNGTPGDAYQCISCHNLVWDETQQLYVFATFRDCTACHTGASPHHTTIQAEGGDCQACHGSLVDNGLLAENREMRNGAWVPTWLPTYSPSQITPWPSNKDYAGPNGEGSCYYCHGQPPGESGNWVLDPDSNVRVYPPQATHHGTGLNTPDKCHWCHYEYTTGPGSVTTSAQSIRTCQNCHGIPSLHNIQYVPEGQDLVPGQMEPWYGHIGANSDCFGCHGFTARAQSFAPMAGPIVPQIDGLAPRVVIAGEETQIQIAGLNFINQFAPMAGLDPVEYVSYLVLSNGAGDRIELPADTLTAESMTVTLPADLPPGNYKLVAKKSTKVSNPESLVVKPKVNIDSAEIRNARFIVVSGSGFGEAPPLAQGLGVTINDVPAAVLSWSDWQILVETGDALPGQTLKVLSTYVVSAPLSAPGQSIPVDGTPRGNKDKKADKKNRGKMAR